MVRVQRELLYMITIPPGPWGSLFFILNTDATVPLGADTDSTTNVRTGACPHYEAGVILVCSVLPYKVYN